MRNIYNKLYVSGSSGSTDAVAINASVESNLLSIVSPTSSQTIFKIRNTQYGFTISTLDIVSTIAGSTAATSGSSGDGGPATSALLNYPSGSAFDSYGNLYIADMSNYKVRKIDTNGIITTFAGNGTSGLSGDSGPATSAQLFKPFGVAVDSNNNVYIVDVLNIADTGAIRKVNTNGIITTVLGITTSSTAGTAGITVDNNNNIYFTCGNIVKKITQSGITTIVAGTGVDGSSGDNIPATSAPLYGTWGIDVDNLGNIYFADYYNGLIRKVDTNGIITTIAGGGVSLVEGVGATSSYLVNPIAVKYKDGAIYVSNGGYYSIRVVSSIGKIRTLAGSSAYGYSGDGGVPLSAKFSYIGGLSFDNIGNLYISDSSNNVIRKITLSSLNTRRDNSAYLNYEKNNNLFAIDGNGVVNLNGSITFKDINFLTQSYRNANGNINGFVLQDGYKITSSHFNGTEFLTPGSFFWMEPGYSKTWNAYSALGDISKISFSASFATDSLVSFILSPTSSYSGLTYSDLFNITLFNNNQPVYLPVIKTYSTSGNLNVSIDTYDTNITNLSAILLGRNINYSYTYSTSFANTTLVTFYGYNATPVTYSLQFSNYYFGTQSFTMSPYKIAKLTTKNAKLLNTKREVYNNNGAALFYGHYYTTVGNYGNTTSGVSYTYLQDPLVSIGATAGFVGANQAFDTSANADANFIYVISSAAYGSSVPAYITRYHMVNGTNVTQSVIWSNNYLPTQSLVLSASSSKFIGYGFSDVPKSAFYIANTSSISATFSAKQYYTKGNFISITQDYNPISSVFSSTPTGAQIYSTSSTPGTNLYPGTQSSVIFYLGRGEAFTLTQPLPVDY